MALVSASKGWVGAAAFLLLSMVGCGAGRLQPVSAGNAAGVKIELQGKLHGGQQPVTGSRIQLYAVGTEGEGSPAQPLLTTTVLTDASGGFNITGQYTCTPSSLLYLSATGGNPGVAPNPNLALMALLGPCSSLSAQSSVAINELTTVAAAEALGPFLVGPAQLGAPVAEYPALAAAFEQSQELVSSASGAIQPGSANGVVPSTLLNTLANITAACVNTAGGVAGDGSTCGSLFQLTTPPGGNPPADTVSALALLVANPGSNVGDLFNLNTPSAPFQPALSGRPGSLQMTLPTPPLATVVAAPNGLSFAVEIGASQTNVVRIMNTGSLPVLPTSEDVLGSGGGAFRVGNGCVAAPLAPGGSCTVSVSVAPVDTTAYTAVLALGFSGSSYPVYVPLQLGGLVAGAGRTAVYDTTFASVPAGATVSGDWQIDPAGAGLVSPAAGQGAGTLLQVPAGHAADSRSTRLVLRTLQPGTVVGVGYRVFAGENFAVGSAVTLDTGAGTLNILYKWDGVHLSAAYTSVPVGFPVVPGQPYVLRIDWAGRALTATVTDPRTGLSATVTTGDTSTDTGGIPIYGYMQDSPALLAVSGQFRVDRMSFLVNAVRPHVLFLGDSITFGYANQDKDTWSRMAANNIGAGNNVVSGRPGGTSLGVLDRLPFEVQALQPDVVVLLIGTNDLAFSNEAQYESNMQQIVQAVHAAGSKLVLATLPPDQYFSSGSVAQCNQFLLSLPADGFVRFDQALTANHDGVTYDPSTMADGVHPNAAGNLLMYQQLQSDVPWLFR